MSATAYRFPDGFLWGAATSAYQIEGSPLADGARPSTLHRFAHTPGCTLGGETGDVAADHYNRFREDVAIMRELGLRAYQFSIAWPRVIPTGAGAVNPAGLDFYDALVDELLEAGVTPVPILHVWDLPGDLQDRGGWANRETAERFGEFAAVAFERLGDRAARWLTICEPFSVVHGGYVDGHLAPAVRDLYAGVRAAHHLLLGHGRAVQAFRASGAQGEIGTSTLLTDFQPATDSEADARAAQRMHCYVNELYLDPVLRGAYPQQLGELLGGAWPPPIADGDLDVISSPVDFLGITYYFGERIADGAPEQPSAMERLLDATSVCATERRTGLDWPVHPDGLLTVLRWLRDDYGNPPIVMSETGGAYPDVVGDDGAVDDPERLAFTRDHLIAAHAAIAEGVDLRGWFVWSFLDTWEFSLGFQGRFGLVHVDYETQKRTVKSSGRWFADVMRDNGFERQEQ